MKNFKHSRLSLVVVAFVLMSYTTASLLSNPNCPLAYTGAPKASTPNLGQVKYCTSCHGDFSLNTAGGGLIVTGLPGATYTPGQVYNFGIKINHATANRQIWGFAIKAVNIVDNKVVGTFSTTNSNASLKGSATANTTELSHAGAATTANASNYTYANLTWTAPAVPGANDANIRFYVTGNAGDNDGGEAGDYIYTTTLNSMMSTLPLTLSSLSAVQLNESEVNIKWQTQYEQNTERFDVESSVDGSTWTKIAAIAAAGNSSVAKNYSYTDKKPAAYNTSILYRLKMIDRDGSYKYSDVKTIRLKNSGIIITTVSAQPLHAGQSSIFEIHSNAARKLSMHIFNVNGTTISNINTILTEGVNMIEVPAAKNVSAGGIYFIKFSSDGFEKVIRSFVD
jgi:Reeler domain